MRTRAPKLVHVANTADKDFVEVTGAVSGRYEVVEVREDGTVLLGPDTSIAAITQRHPSQSVSAEEFERHFGHLPFGKH